MAEIKGCVFVLTSGETICCLSSRFTHAYTVCVCKKICKTLHALIRSQIVITKKTFLKTV